MQYAVNLWDFDDAMKGAPAAVRSIHARHFEQHHVETTGKMDGTAITMKAYPDERAEAIIDVLRMKAPNLRAYRSEDGRSWKAI